MLRKLEDFFLQKMLGKIIARGAISIAGLLAGEKAQKMLGGAGFSVSVDPDVLAGAAMALGHGLFEKFKAWRAAKQAPAA